MIDLAIVGLGRWGRVLVDSVQGQSERVRFTKAATRTPANAEGYAAAKGLALVQDLDALLADPTVDGIVLATPHSQHAAQVIQAAAAKKPVFCEKPFTLTRESAAAAVAAATEAGIVLAVGHNRRFLPAVQRMHALIAEGAIGKLLHVEGNMSGHVGQRYKAGMWRVDPSESP
ncbi:MAG: gfo/Idh/MocA family oxidoreductase, partial [Geminicoccaceae bacterium]